MQYDAVGYKRIMQEIKERLIFCGKLCKNLYAQENEISKIDIEICCLQIRKMIELIAMGSLVVNKSEFERIGKNFSGMWKAKDIFREIKRLNPSYFPKPIKNVIESNDNTLETITENVFTEQTIEKVYDKCSRLIHTPNPFGSVSAYEYYVDHIPLWLDYILNTLLTHVIVFPESKGAFIIELNSPSEPVTSMLLLSREEYAKNKNSCDS